MKVFFDACTTPLFAGCLNALIQPDGDEARHVHYMPDYGFTRKTDDVDWITRLGSDTASWIVITGDQRIRKNIAERTAWIRAGLKAYVLAPAYQKTQTNLFARQALRPNRGQRPLAPFASGRLLSGAREAAIRKVRS